MKAQSTAYKAAMAKRIRPPSLLKVEVTLSGTTYSFREDVIIKATKIDEVDPLSRRLPTQTFSFTVADPSGQYDPSNPSGKWAAVDENAEVSVQFGLDLNGTETWLTADKYYLEGVPSYAKGEATFVSRGRLNTLNGLYIYSPSSPNYATAVGEVLTQAGLNSGDYNIDFFELNRRIGNTTNGKVATYAETLQRFAHASGMALYTRDGQICMQRTSNLASPDYTTTVIPISDVAEITMQKDTPIGTLKKKSYSITTGSGTTLWTQTIDLGSTPNVQGFSVVFNEPVTISSVCSNQATVVTYTAGKYGVFFALSGNGTSTVSILGSQDKLEAVETTESLGSGEGIETIDNPLLTFSQTDLIGEWLRQDYVFYLAKRTNYALAHRGTDSIEAGDCLSFQTKDPLKFVQALVLGVRTDYNGALSSVITVKEMGYILRLSPPTISINPNLEYLIISRGDVNTTDYDIYIDGVYQSTEASQGSVTLVPDIITTYNLTAGTHAVEVYAKATGYLDSVKAETTATVRAITYMLTNMSEGASQTLILNGGAATLTFTATTGYELPDMISVYGATLDSWVKATGKAIISDVSANVQVVATATPIGVNPYLKDSSGAKVVDVDGAYILTSDTEYQSTYTAAEMDSFISSVLNN